VVATEPFIGQQVLRKEDPDLLTGQANYIDNQTMPGMLWMAMVRPPYVHATIEAIDTASAAAMPGVVGVFTGADLELGGLPFVWPITEDIKIPTHLPLTTDKIRFNGDAVAVVLAESREQALDAAELVTVKVTELKAVTDMESAMANGAPLVHEELGSNVSVHWKHGGGGDAAIFETAPVIVHETYHQPRLIPNAIEPRGCIAFGVHAMNEWTLISSTQIPHIAKATLCGVVGIPESKFRVIAPDVGGGFGSKLNVYAEEAVALALAKKTGLPVKWIEERSENYVATTHGRGVTHDCTIAGAEDGTITGVKFVEIADMGAYYQLLTPGIPELGAWVYMGPYKPEAYHYEFRGILTNCTPTDAYRGAGRPEATYVLERAVDSFARRVGKDPADVRRMNLHPPFSEATTAICGLNVDSGNYEPLLDKALELSEYEQMRKEQSARRDRVDTKQIGIGLSTYIEMCGLAPSNILGALRYAAGGWDGATIECLPSGQVIVKTGTSPHGQGHETSWSQIVADGLGLTPDDVEVLHGDTMITPLGMDTYGSRSVSVGGVALHFAMEKIKEKARTIAAHELEVSEDDLEWSDGSYRVKGAPDKARTIPELAVSAWHAHDLPAGTEPHLNATAVYDPPNFTWPAGAHVCIVEVDTETGKTDILRYVAVDDCGTIINPMIVEGQVHGGVAQGIAEALYEEAIYDESGNLVTSSMTQYLIPSAMEIPAMILDNSQQTRSTTNPLGVKGIGEAGTIAAPPAVVNAVVDALSHLGVTNVGKPASPERVWRAIQDAKSSGGAA
jgi:carbon-monoxide dehydrogenase large subunit